MKLPLVLGPLCLSLGTAFGQATVFESPTGQTGGVVVIGSSEPRPGALQGIRLLPIECSGRTRLEELGEGQARRRDDVPGASRLLLPRDQGSLYKYGRAGEGGGEAFGYFRVDPRGVARSVFELPGSGPAGTADPLPGRLAVSGDGTAILVGTSRAAGGDLYEIDLRSGQAFLRTAFLDPLVFGRNGLLLLETWGCAVTESGVVRFDRAGTSSASPVRLRTSVSWFGPDAVRSADGSTVAFLAGEGVTRALVFTCGSSGDALQASDRPMNLPGAGFLPEDPTGPALALSPDGNLVAWRAEGSSRECFVRATRAQNRPTDLQLTGPAHFDNTLNDTGVISFFEPRVLGLAMGRRGAEGLVRADYFRIELDAAGNPVPGNLSLTSGILQPPFDYGTLETADGLFRVPGAPASFVLHDGAGAGRLLWIEGSGASRVLLDRVSSLDSLEVAGAYLVASVRRPPGADDPLRSTLSLVQIPLDGGGVTTVPLLEGSRLSRWVGSRTVERLAAVLEFDDGERLGQVRVPSPIGVCLGSEHYFLGPTTGMSPEGWILATVRLGLDHATFAWSDQGAVSLRLTRNPSFLLPGL